MYIFGSNIPPPLVFLVTKCRNSAFFYIYTCRFLFVSPGGIRYVLWHFGPVPRVIWCVCLFRCLSVSLILCSLQAHLSLWYGILSRFLSIWLSVIQALTFCLPFSFAALNLNTHLPHEVVRKKKFVWAVQHFIPFFTSSAWPEENDTAIMKSVL